MDLGFLTNNYIAGIISGLIVAAILAVVSWRRRTAERTRELLIRIDHANRELLDAIRRNILDPRSPINREIIESLRKAIAVRSAVRAADLFSVAEIANEMTSFVLSDLQHLRRQHKQDVLTLLSGLKKEEAERRRFLDSDRPRGQAGEA